MSRNFNVKEVEDGFVINADGGDLAKPKGYCTIATNLHEVAAKACWAFLGKHYPNAKIVTPTTREDRTVWLDVLTGKEASDL